MNVPDKDLLVASLQYFIPDPWTKQMNKKAKKAKAKKKEKEKEKKVEEVKKEKKKKEKKKKRRRSLSESSSDSEFDDIDEQADKVLQAVGLKSGKENSIGPISCKYQHTVCSFQVNVILHLL